MSFIGLRDRVRYRVELGFAFVDDGEAMFKIDAATFQRARAREATARDDVDVARLVAELPTVFDVYDSEDLARASFETSEM